MSSTYCLSELLVRLIEKRMSQLVLMPASPPIFIQKGQAVEDFHFYSHKMSQEECRAMVLSLMTSDQQTQLAEKRSLDIDFHIRHMGRFRLKAKIESGFVAGTIVLIERLRD
jgi:Tfp pilus assembly pilus retraction ATPase PilT